MQSIEEFLEQFNTKYYNFNVIFKIRCQEKFKTSDDLIHMYLNPKGRYLEEYNDITKTTARVPLNAISLPIDVKVTVPTGCFYTIEWNNKINPAKIYTDGKIQYVHVRIYDKEKNQVGFGSYNICPDGTLEHKYEHFHSLDKSKEMLVINNLQNKKVEQYKLKGEKTESLEIYKDSNGVITGCLREVQENHISSTFKTVIKDVNENDLTSQPAHIANYLIHHDFCYYKEEVISLYTRLKKESFPLRDSIKAVFKNQLSLLAKCSNPLRNILGHYCGNTLVYQNGQYHLCIKSHDENYKYYYYQNLKDINPIEGAYEELVGIEYFGSREKWYNILNDFINVPTFVVSKETNELVSVNGNINLLEEDIKKYEEFCSQFIEPLKIAGDIKATKILKRSKNKN